MHGTGATISVKASKGVDPETIRKRVAEILARYTIHHEVVVE